ncbi:MAG: ATP-binding protein [Limisphaerales bacterium]
MPDLILLDVKLPDINGMELCREIKGQARYAAVFVGLISSSEIESDKQADGLRLGADAYITRPIQNRELLARVESLVRLLRAERRLREMNEVLELKVQARTRELSVTVENLRAEVETRKLAEAEQRKLTNRLRNLQDLDQAVLAAKSPEEISEAAVRSAGQMLRTPLAEVWRLVPADDQLVRMAERRSSGVPKAVDVVERMVDNYLVPLISGEAVEMLGEQHPFAPETKGEWSAVLLFPLLVREELVGTFVVSKGENSPDLIEIKEVGTEIARALSLAIGNTDLLGDLRERGEELARLSQKLVQVQEDEKKHLAKELHDEIGQLLTGMKVRLQLTANAASPEVQQGIGEAVDVLTELMSQVRQLSLDLRPQMLDDFGLVRALEWLFERLGKQARLKVEFQHNADGKRLDSNVEVGVFRIVQETLTNIMRHAGVDHARVTLWIEEDNCRVQVSDEGQGFDVDERLRGGTAGLSGMRERVDLMGGMLDVDSRVGKGTCLTVDVPLQQER